MSSQPAGTRARFFSARLSLAGQMLLVSLLGLPLVSPLLRWTSVPCTHDGHLHYHRVAAMRYAWENGVYFSRWLPDLAFGYGFPFFLYREPAPLYLTHFLHLAGLPLPAATNLFYIFCILASGWFTFLWVRDVFGNAAGLVAAVAYMAAPYVLIDALVRGNQVESLALALFPLLLWAGRRFLRRGSAGWYLLSLLTLALLALSHNISLLLFTPFLGLYLLLVGRVAGHSWRTVAIRLTLLLGLALALTSFYTAPALLEMDEVSLGLTTATRGNDFHFNFASLGEIFGPVPAEDPTLINPPLPIRLGWVPVGLAFLGLLSLRGQRRREQRVHLLFMAAAALTFLFFALPMSVRLWETLPLIKFVQFPWRFVGRAALPIALLAGAPFATRQRATIGVEEGAAPEGDRQQARRRLLPFSRPYLPWALGLGLVLLLLEAMPQLYPTYCREEPFPTINTVHEYEHATGMVGVDPLGSYFPITVKERPTGSPMEADYLAGRTPQRFATGAMPAAATLIAADYEPLRARLVVETPVAFQAQYETFAFPGWTVTVDGEAVPVTPRDPTGEITFAVPAGRHTVVVRWQQTGLRLVFGAVSLLAALAIATSAFWMRRQVQASHARRGEQLPGWLLLLAAGLLLAKVGIVDRLETPLRRAAPPPVAVTTNIDAGELHLAGYNLSQGAVASGASFDVDLAWQVGAAPPSAAYQSNLWLADAAGNVWSDQETYRPRMYEDAPATLAWAPGQWAWDSREVQVLSGTPPGRYDLVLTFFRLDNLQPLTLSAGGVALGPTTVIGQIEVERPRTPPDFSPQRPLNEEVGGLLLIGSSQDRETARAGDPLLLTLFWEKITDEDSPADLSVALQDEAGATVHSWTIPPVRAELPAATWLAGERLRGQHLLRLPAHLSGGSYRLLLEGLAIGALDVTAPERSFNAPPYEIAVGATFGGRARLAGYTLAGGQPADSLAVTLVWEALAEMETSYRVFVHLIDASGQILAQSDAEPAAWTRPTTGWMPGEYIVDRHSLALSSSEQGEPVALRVGLFEATSGARLQTDGADYVVLPLETTTSMR